MERLEYYQNKFKSLPFQGTQEWFEARKYSFGGSELATIIGKNKDGTWEELKKNKQEAINTRNEATEWGHMFEPISKQIIQKLWGPIYEFGTIPHCYYPIGYSPDGLMVINEKLVLLEIKNPIKRGVKTIPEKYLCQVQTGLNTIAAHYCLFAQFRFRRCTWETKYNDHKFDRWYHMEFKRRAPDMKPIAWGYFWWDTKQKLLDLSLYEEMQPIIQNINQVPRVIICTNIQDKEDAIQPLPTDGIVLKWKCFEESYSSISPQKYYLEQFEDMLWKKYKEIREPEENRKQDKNQV